MEGYSLLFYIMIPFGLLLMVAAISNWEWYFKQRRAQILIRQFGRTGARWIYGVLGAFFAAFGYLTLTGHIQV